MSRLSSILFFVCLLPACATVEKAPLSTASILIQGIRFYFSNVVPSEIPVQSIGTGETREKAIESALLAAVSEAIGVLVVSDVTVENNRLLRDIAATYSSGIVKSYKVKNCTGKDRVECEISAIVSPFAFREKLLASKSVTNIDGENLYGQYITSRNAIIQRYRITEYFFSKIHTQGLALRLNRFEVRPSTSHKIPIYIEYDIRFDPQFKRTLIELLEKLQRDTGGGQEPPPGVDPATVYIQWGPTGLFENRVWINTFDRGFSRMMRTYESREISIKLKELEICERVSHSGIFTIDWYQLRRSGVIEVDPERLRGVRQLSLEAGCQVRNN